MTVDRMVGQVLGGRYEIEELLGQGGMSAVYRAKDQKLQREVAIKVIHSHLSSDGEFVRRFENEATAIARLRHSNIVQVYDLNHDGDLYYMVLEYVSGETLQRRIKRMNEAGDYIPLREALQFTIEVCKASDYAHHRGMVHRDIKPANVMIDLNGSAILMDFGIARIIEGQQQHTATGAVLGTALYMSPEQIQGLHPDARSDIYSIGVTLFEVLGGRPPFEADSMMTLMMMHLKDPPPDLENLHPGIPAQVRQIVNRSLEKDPANRFQTCAEMAAALQRALDALSAARPPAQTVIEAAPKPEPLKTIIEPAPVAPTRAVASATFVETSPTRPPEPAPWTAPVQPPPPASKKKTVIWVIAAVLLLALVGGGFVLYRQVLPSLASSPAAAVAGLEKQATQAVVLFTQTLPPVVDLAATAEAVATGMATTEAAAVLEPTPTTPPPTEAPTATSPPVATEAPQILPTPTPAAPVIGGADKLAYVFENNIWTANVDGSDLQQITTDGSVKTYLRWLPDGQGFSYITGKCIETADLQGNVTPVTCFNNSTYLDSFEVSPDGTRVALSLDRQLYLLPYDLERLSKMNSHPDLAGMADCPAMAPYERNMATSARWSKDGKLLAAVTLGVLDNNVRGDVVQVFAVDKCIPNPLVQVQFPPPHFSIGEYSRNPTLPGFTWDGAMLFAMSGFTRNGGYGNLHLFNRETYKANTYINPVSGNCCYRDPSFSPDGTYLVVAFQDMNLGANSQTQIYLIPYGTIGAEGSYQPLPLQEMTDPKAAPQPVLRPAAAP